MIYYKVSTKKIKNYQTLLALSKIHLKLNSPKTVSLSVNPVVPSLSQLSHQVELHFYQRPPPPNGAPKTHRPRVQSSSFLWRHFHPEGTSKRLRCDRRSDDHTTGLAGVATRSERCESPSQRTPHPAGLPAKW